MKIDIRNFSGIIPRVSPELLPDNVGQTAENMSIKSGKIHPEKLFNFNAPDRDYVPGQINDDQYRRLYFLDEYGTLKVCGMFPDGTSGSEPGNELISRTVNISAPGEPVLTAVSSPFTDMFDDANGAVMMANSGPDFLESKEWLTEDGIATHIHGRYALVPISQWEQQDNGSYVRTYAYNPWKTSVYYPIEKTGHGNGITTTGTLISDQKWSCPCLLDAAGGTISFPTVKDGSSKPKNGKLYNYSGEEIGSYYAYNEKVEAEEYADIGIPNGATLTNDKETCVYLNERGTLDKETGVVTLGGGNQVIEDIMPGNLKFTISRSYTDISRDGYYVVRAVNDIGEEGSPSDISELVTRQPDERVTIEFSGATSAVAENIVKYRLYRATGGTDGSDFLYVTEIDAVTGGAFQDDLRDEQLNEVMPKFGEVPEDIDGIASMSGGFLAAYKGKDLYFSEPYLYYCFPWEYNQSVPFDIVGIAVRNNYLYVMTTGSLYAFVGDSPDAITPVSMRFDVPCISRSSIAYVQGSVIYAGSTGLVIINNSGARVFSNALFTLEQYKDLHFENCICSGEYDGKYCAVFADKVLMFEFSGESVIFTTLAAGAFANSQYVWSDGTWQNYETNFAQNNTPYGETWITQDFSTANLEAKWKSKEFIFARPVSFTCARVRFDDPATNVTLKLYAEGNLVHTNTNIPCGKAFRLPVTRRECKWSVEVSGNTDITSIEVAESMSEM